MSIQTKKGFTLIELMVVIVIIGILAAIAIPKLFGMSAKAKAQEVGPAASTWVKLNLAYKMETGGYGTADKIAYQVPGVKDQSTYKTGNFEYTEPTTVKWEAKNRFSADKCDEGGSWTAELTTASGDTPEMKIAPIGSGTIPGCLALTPNYLKIGCTDAATNTAAGNDQPLCSTAPNPGGP